MNLAQSFRKARISRKLLLVIAATSGLALILSGTGIVIADGYIFRRDLQRELAALAEMVGDNTAAALLFDDNKVASDTLSALKGRPHMVAACLYQEDNSVFAHYIRGGSNFACPPPHKAESMTTGETGIALWHPIVVEGSHAGTLLLLYDLGEVPERILLYTWIVLAMVVLASLAALRLSSRLRALIATPVARLAAASQRVTESGDYSIRVKKEWEDEIGVLVEAFNAMLARVQTRDTQLQEARNSLQITLNSIGDAVISTDAKANIVFANPVARALLRRSDEELAGKPIGEFFRIVNEYTRQPVESPVERVLRDGVVVGLANHTILLAADGTEIPIDDSAAPIVQNGRVTGVVLVFRDITERRRAQQDAAYLAAIVESSDDAIVGKSTSGIIQSWNRGAERIYGYSTAEVLGRPMRELLPLDRQHEESEILEQIRGGNLLVHFETVRVRKDGKLIDVALTISPIRNRSGEVVGVSHVGRDITEQKRADEQIRHTQKLESLGVLAGGIAHDFNNLLTGIMGNASLAIDDMAESSPARPAIQAVVSASERAAQLAQQMLAYSGKGRFVLEQIDLSERVRDTLPLIRASIPPTVELRLNLAEGLPRIEADPGQMQQVLMNIIINGAEAIPEGTTGSVTVSTRRQGEYIAFEVADTGCGMDESTKARIFDPFYTTKFTGRGLGLSAVMGIVRGHKGTIHVESTPGKGSTFRILLPVAEGDPAPAAANERDTSAANVVDGGTVLVVDDEPVIRNVAKLSLERHGYTVLLAEDGSRGVEIFRLEHPRLRCVVLDLTMPVMSGEETLTRLREIRPDIPIILSSGFNEAQATQRFEGKGLAGFLQKPYRAGVLLERIRAVGRDAR